MLFINRLLILKGDIPEIARFRDALHRTRWTLADHPPGHELKEDVEHRVPGVWDDGDGTVQAAAPQGANCTSFKIVHRRIILVNGRVINCPCKNVVNVVHF